MSEKNSGVAPLTQAAQIAVPKHPAARRTTMLFALIGSLTILSGLMQVATAASLSGVVIVASGALLLAFAVRISRNFAATALHNRATDMILRGELDGATSLLDAVKVKRGAIAQSCALQRATIAVLRGDMNAAETQASVCIGTGRGIASHRGKLVVAALSVRAFARASQGNAAAARADIAAVREAPSPHLSPLARVAVAELMLLASENNIEGLVRALEKNERVLEFATSRERALVRGFERMVALGGSSIYRKPGTREETASAVGDWGAHVAPALRGHMIADAAKSTAPEEHARPAEIAPPLRKAQRYVRTRIVLALGLMIGASYGIWSLLAPTSAPVAGQPHDISPALVPVATIIWPAILTLFGAIFLSSWRALRGAEKIRALENKALIGDDAARAELDAMTRAKHRGSAGSAYLILAKCAERAANFRESLRAAEEGLSRVEVSKTMRNAYSDILVPGLHVERAFALAAMGRGDEANAACESLAAGFPGYAFLSTSMFRVRLIAAARSRDFERAWEIAQTRATDMSISYRDEFLCALLEAQFKGAGQDEHARLGHVLRKNADLRSWIRAVAPGLTEMLGFVNERIDMRVEAAAPDSEEEEAVSSEGLTSQA